MQEWVRPPLSSTTAQDTWTEEWTLLSVRFSFIVTLLPTWSTSVCLGELAVCRFRFPDEDCRSGLNHRHSAALGHSRAGEVTLFPCLQIMLFNPLALYIPHFLSFFWVLFSCLFFFSFRFCSITEQYYRKADGILAVYDLTHWPSFTAVRGWMESVKVSRWSSHGWLDGKKKHAKQFVVIWIRMQVNGNAVQ